MENYLHLDLYPEIRGALAALKGRKLAILSNGSRRMLQKLVQNSGLDRWIDVVISIDSVRTYRPHRSCYALEPVLGVSKEEVAVRLVEQLRSRRRQGLRLQGRLDRSIGVAGAAQPRCSACYTVAPKNSATLPTIPS